MDRNRLIQCQGDDIVYIKHLELRIIELECAYSSRYPESPGSRQQLSGHCRPCEVCRNLDPSHEIGSASGITADNIRLVSGTCPDNQSSQHSRPQESIFSFVPYEPSLKTASPVTADSSTLTKPTQKKRNRLSSFISSVGGLPESSHWKSWASINETQRKNIVFSLVSGLAFPNEGNRIASEQPAPISILLEYGTSMKPAETKYGSAKSAALRPFACFQELIFCSLCAVALEVTSKENVFQAMRSVFRSDAEPKSLRARIRGAKWANRAVYLLSLTEWGSCSWDIIYVASNKVNFYNEFNDYSIKPDELIKGLKPEFYPKDPRYVSIPLAIPSIIRRIYKDLVPIEKICKCLGYELRGYYELDLSGLDQLLAENTGTELIRKRRVVPSSPPSKRRRRNPLPSSPQDDSYETSNGSHSPIHTTSAPSAPATCSDSATDQSTDQSSGYLINTSSLMEGSLESPANSERHSPFEGRPINTSTPMECPLSSGTTSKDQMMDFSVNDSTTSQNISLNDSSSRNDMPDLASSLSNDMRTQSNPSAVHFESENRDGRSVASFLFKSNEFATFATESSMVTSSTSADTPGQAILYGTTAQQQGSEKYRSSNMQGETMETYIDENHQRERTHNLNSFSSEWPSQPGKGKNGRASDNDDPSLPPIDWNQLHNMATNELSLPQQPESDLQSNDLSLPGLPTDWDQLYNLTTNELSLPQQPESDLQSNDLSLPGLPTDWDQLYNLTTNELSLPQQPGSDPQLNNPAPPLPSFHWTQGAFTIMDSSNQHWKQPPASIFT